MTQITANGISVEYDTFGSEEHEPLLLAMGLGAQMTLWRAEFCNLLADRGHYVIRFDNRDCGLSETFAHLGVPDVAQLRMQLLAGETPQAPYDLADMAADALGLLDVLDIESAHVCGASMGGMIVQQMALDVPQRIRSLTSIMSSTGNPELPPGTDEAMAALMSPPATNRQEAIERNLRVSAVIGSPAYRPVEADAVLRAGAAYDRSFYPEGVARQMAAVVAGGNRKPGLMALTLPALVIHGEADPLVPVAAALDTHEALKGSRLLTFEGMGHDLPEPLWDDIATGIAELTHSG